MDFTCWRCFSQSPFSVVTAIPPPAQARTGPAAAVPCFSKKFMRSSSSHRCKKTYPQAAAMNGLCPGRTHPGARSLPFGSAGLAGPGRARGPAAAGAGGGRRPHPARRSSARLPRRPARPSRLGRAGRWGMCRLWADLAHPAKQEVGDGQIGREQPAKRERNFSLNSAEQNPQRFGFSSSVKKSCIFFGETKLNCQTFQLITLHKCSRLLPVSAAEPRCPVNYSVTSWL